MFEAVGDSGHVPSDPAEECGLTCPLSCADYVADMIHDAGGTLIVLKAVRAHGDDITTLKNLIGLLVILARTGAVPLLSCRRLLCMGGASICTELNVFMVCVAEKNVITLVKAGALETFTALQVGDLCWRSIMIV